MELNVRQICSVVGLVSCFGTGFGFGTNQYKGSAIDRIYSQIDNEYINRSSKEVAAQENPIHSRKFEEKILQSELMQKIQKIHREGSTETTLEVTDLKLAYIIYKTGMAEKLLKKISLT